MWRKLKDIERKILRETEQEKNRIYVEEMKIKRIDRK